MKSEPLTKEQFVESMKHNDFVIQDTWVVCRLCSANCGQCGIGNHQGRCQEYLDAHPELLHSPPSRLGQVLVGLSICLILAVCAYYVLKKAA